MEEQERQVALLRERITRLEGSEESTQRNRMGGSTVDDFSIKVGRTHTLAPRRWALTLT
jgi:hypothetical protein